MLLYRDLPKTLKHLEGLSKKDSRAYEKFHRKWAKVMQAIASGAFLDLHHLKQILTNSGLFSTEEIVEINVESTTPCLQNLVRKF